MMIGKRTYCILGTMLLAFASLGAGVSAEQNNEQATDLEDLGILELSIGENGVIEAVVMHDLLLTLVDVGDEDVLAIEHVDISVTMTSDGQILVENVSFELAENQSEEISVRIELSEDLVELLRSDDVDFEELLNEIGFGDDLGLDDFNPESEDDYFGSQIYWADMAYQIRGDQSDYDRVMDSDDPEEEFHLIYEERAEDWVDEEEYYDPENGSVWEGPIASEEKSLSCQFVDLVGHIDGSIEVTTDSTLYESGDIITTEFEFCWVPEDESMSLIAYLVNSNGGQVDFEALSGYQISWSNYALNPNSGMTNLDPNGAHFSYMVTDDASLLPPGEYCWDVLLKVYEVGNTYIPVDTDLTCFTVVDEILDPTPRISMWYGKVNQHNDNGIWMTDPDGVSGAGTHAQWGAEGYGDRKLEYCQKFWPNTVAIAPMSAEQITFYTRGNAVAHDTTKPVWECVQGGPAIDDDKMLQDVCEHGLLRGVFTIDDGGNGTMRGLIMNEEGDAIGNMWGEFNSDGFAHGLGGADNLTEAQWKAVYEDGRFTGLWKMIDENDSMHGLLKGHYEVNETEDGGVFHGKWKEVDCHEMREDSELANVDDVRPRHAPLQVDSDRVDVRPLNKAPKQKPMMDKLGDVMDKPIIEDEDGGAIVDIGEAAAGSTLGTIALLGAGFLRRRFTGGL